MQREAKALLPLIEVIYQTVIFQMENSKIISVHDEDQLVFEIRLFIPRIEGLVCAFSLILDKVIHKENVHYYIHDSME